MRRFILFIAVLIVFIAGSGGSYSFAQVKAKKTLSKREQERKVVHSRDSVLSTLNKSDTSLSSLLQRVEQYTTTFNQIKNNLAQGIDTIGVSRELPGVIKKIDKIISVGNTHKASTFRYLFVLRDNLDQIQDQLEGWQSDMSDINTKMIQNQKDLLKFYKDTVLKFSPSDSAFKKTFFAQLKDLKLLWQKTDSTNRSVLLKVNVIQDQIAISYTKTLDESDQIDSKIKEFAAKVRAGESEYIWFVDPQYNDFNTAYKSTIKLNKLLFNTFLKNETFTHLASLVFFVLVFGWIVFNHRKALKNIDDAKTIAETAHYIYTKPILSALLTVTAIVPYFYNHPPAVYLETLFLTSIILSLVLIKKDITQPAFNFLIRLFFLAVLYSVSNLFIQISNADRYFIFALSIVSLFIGTDFYRKLKKAPDERYPHAGMGLKVFIILEIISLLLNASGRFSLAKIIGVTAVFNLWMLVILFLVTNIIVQALFLQFQNKKGGNSIISFIDYNLVQKKFRSTLTVAASLVWLFFLLQNLNVDDWAETYIGDILDQSRAVGGATFTFGGFVIFIFVIWLSSVASKIISYLYDVSAQKKTDLSALQRKNRTSSLIIKIAVFSAGFLLAVALSGFPLDKLTIIISAFGVGIGFGLQNIVNNLVSGLILAFEKPINIGDVIAVDGHTGTMKEIGIRSSKVVTGDGSEVIIPNGDLISHQVVNWTLSNSNRQIEIRVITAYGIDIAKVKELLNNSLINRDDIMTDPGPAVFVNNVSETAVEFKVLFWVVDLSKTSELKSRVLADIYNDITKQGIQLPSTQKDIFLHFPDGVPVTAPEEKAIDEKVSKTPLAKGQ